MLNVLRFSFKKSKLLHQITKEAIQEQNTPFDTKRLVGQYIATAGKEKEISLKKRYTEELLILLSEDKAIKRLLDAHNCNIDYLRQIISDLTSFEVGQVV